MTSAREGMASDERSQFGSGAMIQPTAVWLRVQQAITVVLEQHSGDIRAALRVERTLRWILYSLLVACIGLALIEAVLVKRFGMTLVPEALIAAVWLALCASLAYALGSGSGALTTNYQRDVLQQLPPDDTEARAVVELLARAGNAHGRRGLTGLALVNASPNPDSLNIWASGKRGLSDRVDRFTKLRRTTCAVLIALSPIVPGIYLLLPASATDVRAAHFASVLTGCNRNYESHFIAGNQMLNWDQREVQKAAAFGCHSPFAINEQRWAAGLIVEVGLNGDQYDRLVRNAKLPGCPPAMLAVRGGLANGRLTQRELTDLILPPLEACEGTLPGGTRLPADSDPRV